MWSLLRVCSPIGSSVYRLQGDSEEKGDPVSGLGLKGRLSDALMSTPRWSGILVHPDDHFHFTLHCSRDGLVSGPPANE